MDAVHLARGVTGRDMIVKIEGTYHGHHDAVMISVKPPAEQMGAARARRPRVPYGLGYPSTAPAQTRVVPFNDADALERALDELGRRRRRDPGAGDDEREHRPAGRRLPRAGARAHARGTASPLIFDEVKTGAAVAAGGATELFGVTPDVVCLAKAICGGLPGGAIGMTDELAELVADGRVTSRARSTATRW